MAEAFARGAAPAGFTFQSAGVEAMGSDGLDLNGMLLRDRASSGHVIEVMKEVGVDISQAYIKRLTPEMVAVADTVIAILKPHAVPDFLGKSGKVTYWDIPDPDEQTLEFYRQTRDEVRGRVDSLLLNH